LLILTEQRLARAGQGRAEVSARDAAAVASRTRASASAATQAWTADSLAAKRTTAGARQPGLRTVARYARGVQRRAVHGHARRGNYARLGGRRKQQACCRQHQAQ